MAFQLSPGVNISEIDLTTVVPSVATSDGAIGGVFRWGPVGERILVDSEKTLVERFGKPTNFNAETFFSAANFLAYGNRLHVVRAAATTNADSTSTVFSAVAHEDGTNLSNAQLLNATVKNENDYETKVFTNTEVLYVAKFPGAIGNSLKISVCDSVNAYSSNVAVAGYVRIGIGSSSAVAKCANATGNTAANTFVDSFVIGDNILVGNTTAGQQYLPIKTISVGSGNSNTATVANTASNGAIAETDFIVTGNDNGSGVLKFQDGDIVNYSNTTGLAIGGLTSGATYYVRDANTTGFKLSSTPFGSVIDITNFGGAEHSFVNNTLNINLTFETPLKIKEEVVLTSTVQRFWEHHNLVDNAPTQSAWQAVNGNTSAMDELHVVVKDEDGEFSGTPGTILEVFQGLSRATDAKNEDNSVNYYKEVVNESSNYIWFANDRSNAVSNTGVNLTSSTNYTPASISMKQGADGLDESNATLSIIGAAYDLFASAENVDISLVVQGKPIGGTTTVDGETVSNFQLANYIIDNICETRKDCIALISPDRSKVLNNVGSEATGVKNWRGAVRSTSYAVLDSGYKYQYDKYNDIYRWVPLNGDVAGLCARTDATNDAWWSPAGFNRGTIKNVIKLAWNPSSAERDILYSNGINPVVTFPGQGTILFGDKTLQAKPSAFDRINVRRLFIVLEKAIATSARFSLFEFNDPFTRSQFKNLVTPFLRNIQGRRGITDFLVVCDETNNTAQVIDSNQFVGDIYIKPARSINFIQLNFVAVGTGVQFSEVVGGGL
jgi:hypothetical protein